MSNINDANRRDGAMIAEWIAKVGRQPAVAVVSHFGMPLHYAQKCLRTARIDGLLSKVRTGPTFMWMLPADALELRKQQRKGRNAYGLALYHRRREAGTISSQGLLIDPPEWPVVQRVVPASHAKPIVCRAPISVFHLGAML